MIKKVQKERQKLLQACKKIICKHLKNKEIQYCAFNLRPQGHTYLKY